jgi:hypothetical protein
MHKSHLLGLHSSANLSADQSVEDWLNVFSNILDTYKKSPLAQRSKHFTRLIDLMSKLMGMNADHCKKEKKVGHGMEEKKKEAVRELLGEDTVLNDLSQKTDLAFQKGCAGMIETAGGLEAWNTLPQPDQAL